MQSCFFILMLSVTQIAFGQKKEKISQKISSKEIEKLSKMSESEIEVYKENLWKSLSKQIGRMMDEHPEMMANNTLSGTPVTLPPKDQFLIDFAENITVEKTQLLNDVARFRTIIKKEIKKEILIELDNLFANSDAIKTSNNAVSLWYGNRREAALYMAALAVEKEDTNPLLWNNFGALLNLSGIYTLAIPILKYTLNQSVKSSIALNNLAQSYLGLGDVNKAEVYFRQCLTADSLNPEANRAMGFISIAKKKNDNALSFFKKEIQIAFRKSSWAAIEQEGMEEKINFSELMDEGDTRDFILSDDNYSSAKEFTSRGPNSDYFFDNTFSASEKESSFVALHLSKYLLLVFPKNSQEAVLYCPTFGAFGDNTVAEQEFWMKRIAPSLQEQELSSQHTMLYSDWATKAINSLLVYEYPFLHFYNDEYTNLLIDESEKKRKALQAIEEKRKKNPYWNHCPAVKDAEDIYIAKISGYLEGRHQILQTRWKSYIDKLGYIASLDPSTSGFVYRATSDYFAYLASISSAVSGLYPAYYDCFPPKPYDPNYTNSSNRLYEIFCKKGIGGKLPFGVVSVNLNCERFEMSASVELLKFGVEKKFTTGTSTVWIGGGLEAEFEGIYKIEATQKLFLVWDKNNVFSDAGVSGTGQITVKHIMKGGFGYSFGVNSGFNASYTKPEYTFINNINKAMGYMKLN